MFMTYVKMHNADVFYYKSEFAILSDGFKGSCRVKYK